MHKLRHFPECTLVFTLHFNLLETSVKVKTVGSTVHLLADDFCLTGQMHFSCWKELNKKWGLGKTLRVLYFSLFILWLPYFNARFTIALYYGNLFYTMVMVNKIP